MIVAALAHVDGNSCALRAAFDAIEEQGIHEVLVAGNLAAGNSQPGEVIDLLRERGAHCVMGAADRQVVRAIRAKRRDKINEAAREAHDALSASQLEWLGGLSVYREYAFEGVSFGLHFGAPTNITRVVAESDNEMIFQRIAEESRTQINIVGGDGTAFTRQVGTTLFVAPGRVSNPTRAEFAVIDTDASPFAVDLRSVEYSAA